MEPQSHIIPFSVLFTNPKPKGEINGQKFYYSTKRSWEISTGQTEPTTKTIVV